MSAARTSASDGVARRRWLVHLTLIVGFLGTILSALELSRRYLGHSGTVNHVIVGFGVGGLVLVHLYQRRHTVARLSARLVRRGGAKAQGRMARSDLILWLLTLNVIASGVADWMKGQTIYLFNQGTTLFKWHAMSAIIIVIYLIMHVTRRRARLRSSHVN